MDSIYTNDIYLNNNPTWHTEDSKWKSEKIINILSRHQINLSSIIEVGCGFGEILFWLSKKYSNSRLIGYDIAESAIAMARSKYEGIAFDSYNNFSEIKTANLCLIIDVIEHIENYYQFLKNVKEKADYFVFHIPLDLSVKAILRSDMLKSWDSVGHIHFFTRELAVRMIESSGFTIIDTDITKPPIEIVRGGAKKKLLSVIHRVVYSVSPNFAIRVLGGYSIMILARSK